MPHHQWKGGFLADAPAWPAKWALGNRCSPILEHVSIVSLVPRSPRTIAATQNAPSNPSISCLRQQAIAQRCFKEVGLVKLLFMVVVMIRFLSVIECYCMLLSLLVHIIIYIIMTMSVTIMITIVVIVATMIYYIYCCRYDCHYGCCCSHRISVSQALPSHWGWLLWLESLSEGQTSSCGASEVHRQFWTYPNTPHFQENYAFAFYFMFEEKTMGFVFSETCTIAKLQSVDPNSLWV